MSSLHFLPSVQLQLQLHQSYSRAATPRYTTFCISRPSVPVIDMRRLQGSSSRSSTVSDIGKACREKGYFQLINHGLASSTLDGALDVATAFFDSSSDEKLELMSTDITRPVRFSSIKENIMGEEHIQRLFLKQYAYPLEEWIHMWPSKPPEYREKMGTYSTEVRKVALQVMEAIVESLGLGCDYLRKQLHDGFQVMASHAYPPCASTVDCPSFGIPPHSDYPIITIILQNSPGLEELDPQTKSWELLPHQHGSLCVHVGNYLEVISNGIYKSAPHKVSANRDSTRVSIASFHSLSMDEKVRVADELVTEHNPKGYKESSLRDFLSFLSFNQCSSVQGNAYNYIDMLKIK